MSEIAFRLYRRAQKFLALPIDEAIDPRDYGEDEASEAELLIAELACALPDDPDEEAVARAIYEAAPETEGGEYVDGFKVSPDHEISWDQICESDDHREHYLKLARAAIAAQSTGPASDERAEKST